MQLSPVISNQKLLFHEKKEKKNRSRNGYILGDVLVDINARASPRY